jgi:hypothetical protein
MSLSKNIFTPILLFILINISSGESKSIVFPFDSYQPAKMEYLSKEEFFKLKEDNLIYSTFKIGNPQREIPAFYNFYNSSLSIHSDSDLLGSLKSYYMPSYSKTFIITDFNKSQDDLIFNEAKEEVYKNFSFLNLTQNTSENNFYLNIGLQNFYTEFVLNEVDNPNFLYQLKGHGLIEDISFSFNYTSEKEGFVNINLEPFEYAPDLYSKENRHIETINGVSSKDINKLGEYLWSLGINKYFYENKEGEIVSVDEESYNFNGEQYNAILNPSYGVIKGPYLYKKQIDRDYFKDLKEKEICSLNKENKKLFYTCQSRYKDEIKKTFPTLYFYHPEFNYTFELGFEDLFFERYGNLYFLICFDMGASEEGDDKFAEISEWILGKPFLKKYQFSFNVGKRRIEFYEKISVSDKNEKIQKSIQLNHLLSVKNVIFIIAFLIFIFVVYYKNSKSFTADKRKRKNFDEEKGKEYIELEDSFVENNRN